MIKILLNLISTLKAFLVDYVVKSSIYGQLMTRYF